MHELATRLRHVGKNLTFLLRRDETGQDVSTTFPCTSLVKCVLGEGLFHQKTELHVCFCESYDIVRICDLGGPPFGIDAQRLCQTGVALREQTLIRALKLLGAFLARRVGGASPARDGLADAAARASDGYGSAAGLGLVTRRGGMAGQCARMVRGEAELARLAADCMTCTAGVAMARPIAVVETTGKKSAKDGKLDTARFPEMKVYPLSTGCSTRHFLL